MSFSELEIIYRYFKNLVLHSSLQVTGTWVMNVTRSLRGSVMMGCHMTEKYWLWILCVGAESYMNCLQNYILAYSYFGIM